MGHKTVGADKAYDVRDFVAGCRERGVTPYVASNVTHQGGSAIDGRTTRHAGYKASQVVRKRIEEHFGWGTDTPTRSTRPRTVRNRVGCARIVVLNASSRRNSTAC